MVEIRSVLHPTDFSESSKHAMLYAFSLAEQYRAKLRILHVIEEISGTLYFDMLQTAPLAQLMSEVETQAQSALDGLVPPEVKEKLNLEYLIRRGVPFLETVRCAEETRSDLIVCGTHGRTGLKHVLFGSVAEKIVRKAPCPVLSVRHPEHRFEMPAGG